MQKIPRFMQRNALSLQALYKHNYWLFRLLLPQKAEWYLLQAPAWVAVYLHAIGRHVYTNEWRLGHFYSKRQARRFAPDYHIRVYHDARLAEAMLKEDLPLRHLRQARLAQNHALAEWLDYCCRYQYRLAGVAQVVPLDVA